MNITQRQKRTIQQPIIGQSWRHSTAQPAKRAVSARFIILAGAFGAGAFAKGTHQDTKQQGKANQNRIG